MILDPVHRLIIASLLLVVLVLLHRGKGGASPRCSAVRSTPACPARRWSSGNLDRLTVIAGVVWAICIIRVGPALQETRSDCTPAQDAASRGT